MTSSARPVTTRIVQTAGTIVALVFFGLLWQGTVRLRQRVAE